jgi:hypothetical protein
MVITKGGNRPAPFDRGAIRKPRPVGAELYYDVLPLIFPFYVPPTCYFGAN